MKRILFSLLTCGICASAFTQVIPKSNSDNSDKWVITKGDTKSSPGKLFVTLPKGTEWDITIKKAGTNTVISNTMLKTSFVLLPGKYDLEINHIQIYDVPVEKGYTTRIKAGVLRITTSEAWTLYDSTRHVVLINSYSPQNRGLPMGNYVLSINGGSERIEIKDEASDPQIQSTTTLPGMNEGRLILKFPLETWDFSFPVYNHLSIYKSGGNFSHDSLVYQCGNAPCPQSYPLPEGKYDISFGGVPIMNVSIKKGTETKLNVGYLKFLANGNYHLFNETFKKVYRSYNSQGTANHPLPPGNYGVELENIGTYHIQVKDEEITELNPIDSALIPLPAWSVGDINGLDRPARNFGRLNTSFPEATNVSLYIYSDQDNSNIQPQNVKWVDLLPGNYSVKLNQNCFAVHLNIQPGKETKIKFGYLYVSPGYRIYSAVNAADFLTVSDTGVVALPIGYYRVVVNSKSYLIRITEGELSSCHCQ